MGKNGRPKGGKKGSRRQKSALPAQDATRYTGPIVMPAAKSVTITALLNFTTSIASNAGGSIATSVDNAPGLSPDWTSYQGVYRTYRTLGARIRWLPYYTTYATSSTPLKATEFSIALCRDASLAPPSTVSGNIQNKPYVIKSIMAPMSITARMNGTPDDEWKPTAAPVATWKFFLVGASLDASAIYGNIVVEYLVQFRNPC